MKRAGRPRLPFEELHEHKRQRSRAHYANNKTGGHDDNTNHNDNNTKKRRKAKDLGEEDKEEAAADGDVEENG